jgi:hypothetical protein
MLRTMVVVALALLASSARGEPVIFRGQGVEAWAKRLGAVDLNEHYRARAELAAAGESAAPLLAVLIRHRDRQVRTTAAEFLGWIGPPAETALPRLIEAVGDRSPEVRTAAATALRRFPTSPETAKVLVAATEDRWWPVKIAAAHTLAAHGVERERALGVLRTAFREDRWSPCDVAEALGALGPAARELAPAIRKRLDRAESVEERIALAGALGTTGVDVDRAIRVLAAEIGNEKAPLLAGARVGPALDRLDPAAREAVGPWLDHLGSGDAVDRLTAAGLALAAGREEDRAIRVLAEAMKEGLAVEHQLLVSSLVGSERIRSRLLAALWDGDAERRGPLAWGLGLATLLAPWQVEVNQHLVSLGPTLSPPWRSRVLDLLVATHPDVLLAWAEGSDPDLKIEACVALLNTPLREDPRELPTGWILPHLQRVAVTLLLSPEGRKALERAIPRLGSLRALPMLVPLLEDERVEVRVGVLETLLLLKRRAAPALDDFRKCLRDEAAAVRRAALGNLLAIGPEAKPALPDVRELLEDEDESVRTAAKAAVKTMVAWKR